MVKNIIMYLSFLTIFGCSVVGKTYSRDKNGTIQIPLNHYQLSQNKDCQTFSKSFLEIERNRFKNETELNSFFKFNLDGTFKLNFLKKDENQKFKTDGYTPGIYCIVKDRIFIEIFYPVSAGSSYYSSIVHEGVIKNDIIILKEFNDIITLKEQ